MPGASDPDLDLAGYACLALVTEGVEHGWAIGTLLAPDGDLGRIWTLSRSLTYRAIDQLVDRELVTRTGTARGRGRDRLLLRATAAGKRAARRWLDRPVDHVRDVRSELLLKLALRDRAAMPADGLLRAQGELLAPVIESLNGQASAGDAVDRWRAENARAVRRFLDGELHVASRHRVQVPPTTLRLSARNQLIARVERITHGDVLSAVRTTLPDGQSLNSVVTNDALGDLDLAEGDEVLVVVKSTEAMLAKP